MENKGMNKEEVRSLLSVYRAGEIEDARFQEALQAMESDPQLRQWWSNEQELDRLIASKLNATHVPAKPAATYPSPIALPPRAVRSGWSRALLLAAAMIIALCALFSSWRGPFQPAASLADYRDEMVGFVRVDPSLELKSSEMRAVHAWLAKSTAPSRLVMPKKVEQMAPVGCRTLRYRGHEVGLICFRQTNGKLLHLLVVEKGALPNLPARNNPEFSSQGEWMTAAWQNEGVAYLLVAEGDRALLERYIENS